MTTIGVSNGKILRKKKVLTSNASTMTHMLILLYKLNGPRTIYRPILKYMPKIYIMSTKFQISWKYSSGPSLII